MTYDSIESLYEMKDKWTMKELKHFFGDLEISNLPERIKRLTQAVTEENLFDKSKKQTCP